MDKKGFLFTVTVFLVLTYILLSISVWVKGVETSERAYSEFYKESTVELAIEQITPEKMDKITNTILIRDLHRLNEHSIDFSVKEGPAGNESENIRGAMFELMMNGSANSSYFKGSGGDIAKEENSSLTRWAENLNSSLLAIGVYLSDFGVTNFQIGQSDVDLVNYSFDIYLEMKDFANTTSVSRTYHISNVLNITGLVDPALTRKSKEEIGDELAVYRMFFFNKAEYPDHSAIEVSKEDNGEGGQGWVYAPLALANGTADLVPEWSTIPPTSGFSRKYYILVGTFDEITALTEDAYQTFAGYIITTSPSTSDSTCGEVESDTFNPITYSDPPDCEIGFGTPTTDKPFIIVPDFNPVSAPECPILDGSNLTRRCVLLQNAYSVNDVFDTPTRKHVTTGSGIYEMEEIRDFAMCGYYTHNPDAPSYLQRLLNDSYERNDSVYGIETFVIGNYANDYSFYDLNSRLDREIFDGIDGIRIRGMPGCKAQSMCSDEPVTGIFAVSDGAKSDYDLDDVACDTAAGCD